jgi:hypothetical protein
MSEFLVLHYESKYDFLLHLCIFDVVTGYKRTPFGRFFNSKKYKILRTYRKMLENRCRSLLNAHQCEHHQLTSLGNFACVVLFDSD